MKDGIIKAEGNSRLARSVENFRAKYPTYDDFANALVAGTLPLDILFNADGWSQLPDFLNKATLLKDDTAALYGKVNQAVPDDIFKILSNAVLNGADGYTDVNGVAVPQVRIATGSYVGTGTYGSSNPCSLTFDFVPRIVMIQPGSSTAREARFLLTLYGAPSTYPNFDSTYGGISLSWSENKMEWYNYHSSYEQLNSKDVTYFWTVFG